MPLTKEPLQGTAQPSAPASPAWKSGGGPGGCRQTDLRPCRRARAFPWGRAPGVARTAPAARGASWKPRPCGPNSLTASAKASRFCKPGRQAGPVRGRPGAPRLPRAPQAGLQPHAPPGSSARRGPRCRDLRWRMEARSESGIFYRKGIT